MENIEEALKLMVVGLATVFAVLLIIIYSGKALIAIVRKYVPEAEAAPASPAPLAAAPAAIDPGVQAAIQKAVDSLTGGKATVVKIERR